MPIIKWAGGKTQLLNELERRIPRDYSTYVEPFFGSGALFFDIKPQKTIINDCNKELINMYVQLRDNPNELRQRLLFYEKTYADSENKQEMYYTRRSEYNKIIKSSEDYSSKVDEAALLIFLNKTCYNGLYRVNMAGEFNTPWGKKSKVTLIDQSFEIYSNCLKNALIINGDFEDACKNLKSKTFVYFDSPYYDTFDTYQAGGFPESEHIRLAKLFKRLSDNGIYCMLSNSNTDFIKSLYKDYDIEVVPVKRMINCNGEKRTGTEIIVRNY